MSDFFRKGLKPPKRKVGGTKPMTHLSQEEELTQKYQDLARRQYDRMGESSSKRITEEPFPEDKSFSSSDYGSGTKPGHASSSRPSQPLPEELEDVSMSESEEAPTSMNPRDNPQLSKTTRNFDSSKVISGVEEPKRKTNKSVFPEDVSDSDSDSSKDPEPKNAKKSKNLAKSKNPKEETKTGQKSEFPSDVTPESSSDLVQNQIPSSESYGQANAFDMNNLGPDTGDKKSSKEHSEHLGPKYSENVDYTRGRGQQYEQPEPDGEQVRGDGQSSKHSNAGRRDSEISEIINGDILPDDAEEFDYGQAKRESDVHDLQNDLGGMDLQDYEIQNTIPQSNDEFWAAGPPGWEDNIDEDILNITILRDEEDQKLITDHEETLKQYQDNYFTFHTELKKFWNSIIRWFPPGFFLYYYILPDFRDPDPEEQQYFGVEDRYPLRRRVAKMRQKEREQDSDSKSEDTNATESGGAYRMLTKHDHVVRINGLTAAYIYADLRKFQHKKHKKVRLDERKLVLQKNREQKEKLRREREQQAS